MLRDPFDDRVGIAGERPTVGRRRVRLIAAIVAGGTMLLLVVANRLQPDPRGFGTHQQLGLPSCTFKYLFNARCPACGMTTAWAHFAQGHPLEAMRVHVAGTLLATGAVGVSVWAAAIALGFWREVRKPREQTVAVAAVCMTGLLVAEWLVRMFVYG